MNIVLIGAGNVATQLGLALKKNHTITQVFSRHLTNASSLAKRLNATATDNIEKISTNADIYFLSVTDDAIKPLVNELPSNNGIVVHTAGSVSIDVLGRYKNYGIFYPFQTFSKNRDISFDNIPIMIEGNAENTTNKLFKLASSLSANVHKVNSEQRLLLHIAAVFACNFTNHLYHISKKISDKAELPFNILQPLIEETVSKAFKVSPENAQTGPAARDDRQTMDKHIDILNKSFNDKKLVELYKNLSNRISGISQP
jgi:predicted short-subunit dehydrogenase-like oxidoreductase (DUF2520 family)